MMPFLKVVAARAAAAAVCLAVVGCSSDPAERAARFLENGNRYFEQQKYREASIEFRNAVQADGRSGVARRRLADSFDRLGEPAKALEEYVRAADLLPDDAALQITAGNYLLAARRFEDAKARAEAALKLQPRDVQAQVLLGNSLAGLRNVDQAIAEIEEAIRIDPTRGATYTNLGILQMSRGRAEAAEAAFKRSIELAPKWAPAHLSLANHYWATGKRAEAEQSLRAALEAEPKNPNANRAMALFLISNNRAREAEPFVRAVAESGAAPFALADFYLLQNRASDAIPELQQLRTGQRTAHAAARRLAQAYAVRGDYDDAQRVVDDLLQKDPRDSESLLLKGQLLARVGKREEALAQLKAAAEVDPSSPRLQFALGRSYAARGDVDRARTAYNEVLKLNPRAAGAQVELARLELLSGKVDNAVRLSREAVRNEPRSLDASLSLVRGLLARGDIAGAEKILDPIAAAAPNVPAVHVQKGTMYLARKDPAAARRAFERALELDPDSFEALSGLVVLDISGRNIAGAQSRIDARLKQHPNRADLLMIAARASAAARDLPATEQYLVRAIQADPSILPAYGMLGQLYVAQGKLDQARKEFQALAERQARPVAAVTMLGILAQTQGDDATAQKHYEQVVSIDPAAPVAANNLAWMYADRGTNLETALQLAQKATEAMPNVAEVHDTLGWVYYKRQTSDRAVEALRNTVKLAPRNAIYHYHLGLAYAQDGNVAGARESLERALTLDKSFANAADARRVLDELRAR
jgi:tetratricopeptide (TPR) repeat protein